MSLGPETTQKRFHWDLRKHKNGCAWDLFPHLGGLRKHKNGSAWALGFLEPTAARKGQKPTKAVEMLFCCNWFVFICVRCFVADKYVFENKYIVVLSCGVLWYVWENVRSPEMCNLSTDCACGIIVQRSKYVQTKQKQANVYEHCEQ